MMDPAQEKMKYPALQMMDLAREKMKYPAPEKMKDPAPEKMKKKVVLKVDFPDSIKGRRKLLKKAVEVSGIESVHLDSAGDKKVIVIGEDVDIIALVVKLRKIFPTELVSVGPANEPQEMKAKVKKDSQEPQEMKAEVKKDSQEITCEPIQGPGVGNDIGGLVTPARQNLSAPAPKSREEEDREHLPMQAQYSYSTMGTSERESTMDTAPKPKGCELQKWGFSSLPWSATSKKFADLFGCFRKPDRQNLPSPVPKSRGEEDSERLQLLAHQYLDPTIVESTSGTALEGGVLSMEKLVRLNKMGEVTEGQNLFPEVEESLNEGTESFYEVEESLNEGTESFYEVEESLNEGTESFYEELLEEIMLEELEETPSDPRQLEELNCHLAEVPPKVIHHFSILCVVDLSYTEIYSLPPSISRLIALRKLLLRSCELLMELPPEIGELTNLEVLDLEGTEILCLPKEIAKLVNLTCLKVSFYEYANQTVIPRRVLSNLSHLIELIIDVTPYGEWWDVDVEAIIDDLCSLKELTTLKLSLPTAELLKNVTIFRRLENFRFTVGRHEEHFNSRLPHDVEEEFNNRKKLEKGLKYINGSRIPNEITEVCKHANAFFLQRHWTAKSLSEFGHENVNEVKYCLVMECNEFRTIIDSEQFYQGKDGRSEFKDFQAFDEPIVLGSLEKLIIRYMKNMESVWKGPVGKGSLSNLKSLTLHACPNLTILFTIDVFRNLLNLEELIVKDCPKIDSLVSLKSSDSKSGVFLPNLKKISLLELPELVSISSGLCIAPNLERMIIFYCPKLEKLSTVDVSSTKLKVIKGEKEWWDALKWYESDLSTEHEDYLACLFIPLRRDGDLMAQLTKD